MSHRSVTSKSEKAPDQDNPNKIKISAAFCNECGIRINQICKCCQIPLCENHHKYI